MTIRLALAISILLAACAGAETTPQLPARVGILGDSIAFQSAQEIDVALAPAIVRNESAVGRRLEQAAADARRLARWDPDVVVVILGANDSRGGSTDRDLDEVEWLAGLLDPVGCVLWLEVSTTTGSASFDAGADALNRRIAANDDVHLVRWPDGSGGPPSAWARDDGVHLNDVGQDALADHLRDAVIREC